MGGKDNLVPFTSDQSHDEAVENGRKGGIASGQSRRDRKTMREWAEVFGAVPVKVKLPDGTTTRTTTLGNIVAAQMAKATKGDTKAAKFVAELLGEMVKNVNINGIPPLVISNEEAAAIDTWARDE